MTHVHHNNLPLINNGKKTSDILILMQMELKWLPKYQLLIGFVSKTASNFAKKEGNSRYDVNIILYNCTDLIYLN